MNYLGLEGQVKPLKELLFPQEQIEDKKVEEYLESLVASLDRLSNHKFLEEMLYKFAEQLTENADEVQAS